MSDERVNVLAIVEAGLRAIGADGLCTLGCGCLLHDLALCREYFGDCVPAKVNRSADPSADPKAGLRPLKPLPHEAELRCDICGSTDDCLTELFYCEDCDRSVCDNCCHDFSDDEIGECGIVCVECDPGPWDEPPTNPLEQIEDAMRMIQEHTGLTPERPDDERS